MLNRLIKLLKEFEQSPEKLCPSVSDGGSCGKCEYNIDGVSCMDIRRAEYLLKNGVLAPPCKVGDTVYSIENCINRPEKIFITAMHQHEKYTSITALSRSHREYVYQKVDFGKTVFLTKEEAEQALKDKKENENV